MSEAVYKTIENLGVVPVVVINDVSKAEGLAQAFINGGLPCAEVTFRTAAAQEAIRRMSSAFPQMLVGAGTVVSIEQAQRAVEAGAKFLVSPGYDQTLVDWAKENKVVYFPGVCTPSELQVAAANGFTTVKFFPAEASGGVGMIKNLAGPFPNIKFMTTGGISPANIGEYTSCPNVAAVGGSWMAKADMINAEKWDEISKLCRQAVCAVHGFKFAHLGINAQSKADALDMAKLFEAFGMNSAHGEISTFMDTFIEIMYNGGRGTNGHIGFSTYNIDRALAYLETLGFTPEPSSAQYDAKGKVRLIYLKESVGGFALHLKQA